jgi:hypothetical protein
VITVVTCAAASLLVAAVVATGEAR